MKQKNSSNSNGFNKGEIQIFCSPTGRNQSRLTVNLPGDKENVAVILPELDFTKLEGRVASLMRSADQVIGIEHTVATPGQTFQLFNSRTGKETTYQLKDTGDWEDVH